ncbi:response regulator [Asticcacaulis sp. AC402]|uniref:response regulator n=1 Tax=Asticcacaulis sp. AC402 TaxID=1282361 RepID=UPI0004CFBED9|nr:response regulator [Asticcacaulis sp. AC402]
MSLGTVLVLEDSRVQAQLISKMLTAQGWSAMMAFDHKTVYQLLRTTNVDLLLLDVYVEGGNTLLHLPEIREMAHDIPVAIMTAGGAGGQALNATLNAARRAQADFVLPKPFTPVDLRVILDEAYQMRRSPTPPKHILVVDDCRVVRKLTTSALAEKGYRISEARSMEEAFERIDIAHIDVVITDIFMPGMGGIEGISIIKATWPEVAIIAMSAGVDQKVGNAQVLSAARHMGAHALLPKPFTASDLCFLVEAVLTERSLAA